MSGEMVKPRIVTIAIYALLVSAVYSTEDYKDFDQKQTTGVFYDWGATKGYNFFAPSFGINSFIVDNDGNELHRWQEPDGYALAGSAYLTDEGTLLRGVRHSHDEFSDPKLVGGGRIREYNKQGTCIWEFRYSEELYRQTGDFVILPNGNIIVTAWENHSMFTAKARGYTGEANSEPHGYWSYTLIEVPRTGRRNEEYSPISFVDNRPDNTCQTYSNEDDVVWKWDQFYHSSDYIKYSTWDINKKFEISALDYLPGRDHIVMMCQPCGELFIIDHSVDFTKVHFTDGQFIYRWGNPENYGKEGKKMLDADNVKWVRSNFGWEFEYEGKISIFNNNDPQEEGVSSVVILNPPFKNGKYYMEMDGTFAPKDFDYKIAKIQEKEEKKNDMKKADESDFFYGGYNSGYFGYNKEPLYEYPWRNFYSSEKGLAQILPNGNIFVTSSFHTEIFELQKYEKAIWKYVSPFINTGLRVNTLLGPECELKEISEIPMCNKFSTPCNAHPMVIKYSEDFKGFSVLFPN